jgi:hypothetical protein
MPALRKTTDPDRLSDEQREALDKAKAAQRKVGRAKSSWEGAVSARDDLIRAALDAGVGVMLIAQQLGVNGALIWKIRKGLTTSEVERRREAGQP